MSNAVGELRKQVTATATAVASLEARAKSAQNTLPVSVPAGGDHRAVLNVRADLRRAERRAEGGGR